MSTQTLILTMQLYMLLLKILKFSPHKQVSTMFT